MEPKIVTHRIVCPADQCSCGKGGGKLLATLKRSEDDSLSLQLRCPNAKRCPLYFRFGPTPPADPK